MTAPPDDVTRLLAAAVDATDEREWADKRESAAFWDLWVASGKSKTVREIHDLVEAERAARAEAGDGQ